MKGKKSWRKAKNQEYYIERDAKRLVGQKNVFITH